MPKTYLKEVGKKITKYEKFIIISIFFNATQ